MQKEYNAYFYKYHILISKMQKENKLIFIGKGNLIF